MQWLTRGLFQSQTTVVNLSVQRHPPLLTIMQIHMGHTSNFLASASLTLDALPSICWTAVSMKETMVRDHIITKATPTICFAQLEIALWLNLVLLQLCKLMQKKHFKNS
jgi:hypothetical protein